MEDKIIIITGASSGLGKICGEYLSKKGYMVYGTSRNPSSSPASSKMTMVSLDVDDDESVHQTIFKIFQSENKIDVVINCAGWGISGAVEDVSITDTKALFETNFYGTLRVIKQVLPIMRKQQKGLIINISSIGGVLGLPFQGTYSATKFAVEGISEALRMEVKSFGIDVVLVEPGDFKTAFTMNRKKQKSTSSLSPYLESQKITEAIIEQDEQQGCDPLLFAKLVEKIINSNHPRLRYRVGSFSQKFVASLKGVVSDRLVQWMVKKYYKVK